MRASRSPIPAARSATILGLVGILLLATFPAGSAQQAPFRRQSSIEERVDAVFADYDTGSSPGCSLGIVRAGELVYGRGYGMANLEHGVRLSEASVFRIGSTSKQFTAAAIVLLEQEGTLSLDDDVRRFLPELPEFDPPVTIRHLVHHTSGYRDYLTLMSLAGYRDDDYYTDDELLAMLSRQRQLNFPPGSEHLYSNSGYWLLSQVVERATGTSLRAFAAERIFGPLGMGSTHFHDDHTELVPNRASGYAPAPAAAERPGASPDRPDAPPSRPGGYAISMTTLPMIGDGGVFTTVEDLARWDRNFSDPRVGGRVLVERLHERGVLNDGTELDYAFGLRHGTYRGLRTVSHGGSFVGFRAEMMRFPDQGITIICLCNRADASPTRRAQRVADIVLSDRLGPAEPDDERREGRGDEPVAVELADAELQAFVGDYHSVELDVVYRIRPEGRGLRLAFGKRDPIDLAPIGDDRLRARSMTLRFERDASGRFSRFLLDAGRVQNLRFERRQR